MATKLTDLTALGATPASGYGGRFRNARNYATNNFDTSKHN